MQTYYEKIVAAVLRPDITVRRIAYGSLRTDPGLHQLVPYFVQFVADKVRSVLGRRTACRYSQRAHLPSLYGGTPQAGPQVIKHLKDVDTLTSLMWMVRSLVENTNLFLEPYVRSERAYRACGAPSGLLTQSDGQLSATRSAAAHSSISSCRRS